MIKNSDNERRRSKRKRCSMRREGFCFCFFGSEIWGKGEVGFCLEVAPKCGPVIDLKSPICREEPYPRALSSINRPVACRNPQKDQASASVCDCVNFRVLSLKPLEKGFFLTHSRMQRREHQFAKKWNTKRGEPLVLRITSGVSSRSKPVHLRQLRSEIYVAEREVCR